MVRYVTLRYLTLRYVTLRCGRYEFSRFPVRCCRPRTLAILGGVNVTAAATIPPPLRHRPRPPSPSSPPRHRPCSPLSVLPPPPPRRCPRPPSPPPPPRHRLAHPCCRHHHVASHSFARLRTAFPRLRTASHGFAGLRAASCGLCTALRLVEV